MKKRIREIVIVSVILGVILSLNLVIYFNYKQNIETNYYSLPDIEDDEFDDQLIVFVALEKKIESDDPYYLRLGIFNVNNTEVSFGYLEEWKWNETDGKLLYFCNFTGILTRPSLFGYLYENQTYNFFLHFRSWFSPEFRFFEQGYFQWE